MQINRRTLLIGVCALGVLIFLKAREISHAPGVLVSESPLQTEISDSSKKVHVLKNGSVAESLARYRIKARVLSTNRYWFDPGASISPLDLALGWGPMSDSRVLDEMSFSQSLRYYHIRWHEPTSIPTQEIMKNSANVHVIPANEWVRKSLLDLRTGHLIEMSGDLVVVSSKDGGEWRSSLSRDDTGAGACELMYVESLKILNP